MFDFTHKKRPDFVQLILIIAVVCLALGAITPSVSAVDYDWEFSVQTPGSPGQVSGTLNLVENVYQVIPNALPGGYDLYCDLVYAPGAIDFSGYTSTLTGFITNPGTYMDFPITSFGGTYAHKYFVYIEPDMPISQRDPILRSMAEFLRDHTDIPETTYVGGRQDNPANPRIYLGSSPGHSSPYTSFSYSYEPFYPSYPFYIDVVDSGTDYLISVSGIDGAGLAGSTYTISVSSYSGGYNLHLSSFPMYLGDSPVHVWDSDQTFRLPVYMSDGVTPIDYYCYFYFPADPTHTAYPFWWNLTVSGSSGYPWLNGNPPVVPTPTPFIPKDIIPDPNDLNNTINITGWYQDQGFTDNSITAPIYDGLRGWFNENLVPVIDFFLTPTNYVATVISDSAETSTDGISYITEELGSYAAPFNTVGSYVVRLVPEVVWIVVFAALSIGYVVLLIRVSTGSIKDTIGRFLGGK